MLKLRDAEGSCSARPGDRGLALVALLTGCWTEFSKDEIDGVHVGDLIGRELARVEAKQRDDELFYPEDPTANAWTALALTEAYGLTGKARWQVPARRAAEAVQGMPACDETALLWKYRARVSAHLVGFMDKGPEPRPLDDPLRGAVVAGWWGRKVEASLPAGLERATAEAIYLADVAVILGKPGRYTHRAWDGEVVPLWARRKEPIDLGAAAFRAMSLIPCDCYGCRSPFRKD